MLMLKRTHKAIAAALVADRDYWKREARHNMDLANQSARQLSTATAELDRLRAARAKGNANLAAGNAKRKAGK